MVQGLPNAALVVAEGCESLVMSIVVRMVGAVGGTAGMHSAMPVGGTSGGVLSLVPVARLVAS